MRYLVPIVTTIILISLITYSPVVNGGGNELKDIRDMNSVMEDLREAAKILKEKYLRLGKYVDIGNYFGVKTYVISSTILNPTICGKDSDGDGLCDHEEELIGTDPKKFDTDGDGLPDGLEVGASLYVFSNALLDTEGGPLIILVYRDGKPSNSSIYYPCRCGGRLWPRAGMLFREGPLNPLAKDTDGDGLTDLYEVTQTLRISNLMLAGGCSTYGDVARIGRYFGIKTPSRYDYCVAGGPLLNPFIGVTLRDISKGVTIYGRLVYDYRSNKRVMKYPVISSGRVFPDILRTAKRRWFPSEVGNKYFIPSTFKYPSTTCRPY